MGELEPFDISKREEQKIPLMSGCISYDSVSEVQYQCFF